MAPPRRWKAASRPPGKRQRLPYWVVLAVVGFIGWAYSNWDRSTPGTGTEKTGDTIAGVARVTDGDSLEIGNVRVRLYGIDAPEFRQLCKDASGRDYTCGLAAREALGDLTDGKTVSCQPAEGPSYDRVVARCSVDGPNQSKLDLSEQMIRAGRVIELKSHSKGRYAAAERAARDARRGLWAGTFERPSQWRQRVGR